MSIVKRPRPTMHRPERLGLNALVGAVLIVAMLLATIVLQPVGSADAAEGDLDTTFDTDGKQTSTGGGGEAVVVESDGNIVVAGGTSNLRRYSPTGTEIGSGGSNLGSINGMAQRSDGLFITAGTTSSGGDILLQLFKTDLSPETTFGTAGAVTVNMNESGSPYKTAGGFAITIDADGKYVVAGYVQNNSFEDFFVLRFNADGTLDSTFNPGGALTPDKPGMRTITIDSGKQDRAYAVDVQPDGKIVVVGESGGSFAMARFNADGSTDTGFGTNGIVEGPNKVAEGRGVLVESNGDIIVVGSKSVTDPSSDNCTNSGGSDCEFRDFYIARYNSSGQLLTSNTVDTSAPKGNDDEAFAVVAQQDGKLLLAGRSDVTMHSYSNGNQNGADDLDFALARFNTNLTIDSTFAGTGHMTTSFTSSRDEAAALALQSDGKIVLTGRRGSNSSPEFATARYDAAAALGAIGDRVWDDTNGNGIQDSGEPGLSGVSVELLNAADGTTVSTATTDSNGNYQFLDVQAGSYSVKFTAPLGREFTAPDQGGDDTTDSDPRLLQDSFELLPSGDPDGSGSMNLTIDPLTSEVCYTLETANIAAITAMHIHTGGLGMDGGVIFSLDFPSNGSAGCVTPGITATDLLVANPPGHYVNVHTTEFGAGALRSQIPAFEGRITEPFSVAGGETRTDIDAGFLVTTDPSIVCDNKAVTINMNTNGGNGTGTAGDDVILGTPGNDVMNGMGGNDTMCGEDGNDIMNGGDGDDILVGGDGDDTMNGEDGKDKLRGNPGVDIMDGGLGNDRLQGGIDGDTLNGGEGNDFLGGFGGDDTINGGPGNDLIFGGFGRDTIHGNEGNDEIRGLIGDDTISGDEGNDKLFGDRGNDRMNGNAGDDTMGGGNGNDVMFGDDGDDVLGGGKADDTLSGGPGEDTCTGNLQNAGGDTADSTCEKIFGVP